MPIRTIFPIRHCTKHAFMLINLKVAYLSTEMPYLGKSIHFFLKKFDEELKYAIGFSAVFTRKKF